MTLFHYLFINIYIGAGIAADVYAATLGSFREFSDDNYLRKWVRRNTITHTLFPMMGMYAVILGITAWRSLQSILFGFGALLLGSFLWNLIREKSRRNQESNGSAVKPGNLSLAEKSFGYLSTRVVPLDPQWLLVLGVSVDAINSGFAKAADTKDWPLFALLISFPLVGLVVGAGAWAGGKKAKWFLTYLNRAPKADIDALTKRLTRLQFFALLIELLVLGYFFWRSVASALVPLGVTPWIDHKGLAWAASGICLFLVLLIYGRAIVKTINEEGARELRTAHFGASEDNR